MKKDEYKELIKRFDRMEEKIDRLRTSDIPEIERRVETLDTKVEERTGKKAIIIAVIIAFTTAATSIGAAFILK